jgi:hypothetical protein
LCDFQNKKKKNVLNPWLSVLAIFILLGVCIVIAPHPSPIWAQLAHVTSVGMKMNLMDCYPCQSFPPSLRD